MKPASFQYLAPSSLEEALACLGDKGLDAKVLAGGQSLVPMLSFRLLKPAVLIDLNGLEKELGGIGETPQGGLRLGALVRQRRLEREAVVAQRLPILKEVAGFIAHPQIRNRGTVGGSLAHADPAAELPALALALGARLRLQSRRGERWVEARAFYLGLLTTDLAEDELLTQVELPPPAPGSAWVFDEVARRHGDYAQVGVVAGMSLDAAGCCTGVRLVFLSVGDIPMDARRAAALVEGQPPSADLFSQAASLAAREEIEPSGDIHASVAYKRHLAAVLAARVLSRAAERAKAGGGVA